MYVLARAIAQCIVATFFGEVHVVGLERIPVCGPVIFVSNHNNKFVDASIVMACIPRSLRFLIATVSLKVRVVGRLAKFAGAIGVNRPQDMKYMGIGRITDIEPYVEEGGENGAGSPASAGEEETYYLSVRGNELTRFRIDCKKHDKMDINGESFLVEKVVDDHLMIVSQRRSSESENVRAASALTTAVSSPSSPPLVEKNVDSSPSPPPSYPFTIYPKVDQGEVYESVSRALYEGSSICLFPEGGSHDQPGLLPLKPGVAVMALNSAMLGVEDVLIVPVGIHYFDRDKFGSQAVVEIGHPLALTGELLSMYREGSKKEAVKILMSQVRERLEDCLIYGTSSEMLQVIKLCASLYPPDRLEMSVEKHHRLQALFSQLLNRVESVELEGQVLEYGRLLEANGLQDNDVINIISLNAELAAFKILSKALPLLLLSIVVLPALAVTYPLRWLSKVMTERHRSEALANSNVKVTAVDVIASYKIVWCICFLPIVFLLNSTLLVIHFTSLSPHNSPLSLKATLLFLLSISLQPLLTYWGLKLRNKLPSYLKQIRCYYKLLISELDVWRGGEKEVMIDRIDLQLKVRQFIKEKKEIQNHKDQIKIQEVFNELENLIPAIVIETDNRRIMRQIDKLMPVVYRSAVMSREEIL